MNKIQKIVAGIVLVLIGVLQLLDSIGIYSFGLNSSYYYLMMCTGLVFVYTSIGKGTRAVLFSGAVLFITGLIIFLTNRYEILNPIKILIPSVLITFGSGFLLLFIDNTKEKVFLILSVIMLVVSVAVIKLTGSYAPLDIANRMVHQMIEFWPVLISLIGIGLLANSRGN